MMKSADLVITGNQRDMKTRPRQKLGSKLSFVLNGPDAGL